MLTALLWVIFINITNLIGGVRVFIINLVIIYFYGVLTSFQILQLKEIIWLEAIGVISLMVIFLLILIRKIFYKHQNIMLGNLTLLGVAISFIVGSLYSPGVGSIAGVMVNLLGIGKVIAEKGIRGLLELYSVTFLLILCSLVITLLLAYFLLT